MRTSHLSLLIGLTTSATLAVSFPVKAANFDYSTAQFIKTRPLASNDILGFFGNPNDPTHPAAYSAFFNVIPGSPDGAARENAKNSPVDAMGNNNPIPYYTTGWDRSDAIASNPATASAFLQDKNGTAFTNSKGFNKFFNYLTSNSISLSDIGLSYGQKLGLDIRKTWNLGENILGQDRFSDPNLTLEERIYKANPNEVEIGLYLGNTQFVNFGYSDFYSFLEYGETTDESDDSEAILSDPFKANKATGLNPLLGGLADAFLADLGSRQVQAVFEDFASPADPAPDIGLLGGAPYALVKFRFPITLRAVSVPEPASVFGFLIFGALGLLSRRQKQNKN